MTEAQDHWKRCKPWIESALPYTGGTYTIEDIESAIAAGEMIFMPGEHCAVILEIVRYPNAKWLNVFLGGGEPGEAMGEYFERIEDSIVAFAKAAECSKIMHMTRPSGERVGKKLGYCKQWTVMVKDVE